MTDRLFLVVAGVIAAAIAADVLLNDAVITVFLVRKLFHMVDYLEFWRLKAQSVVEIGGVSGLLALASAA